MKNKPLERHGSWTFRPETSTYPPAPRSDLDFSTDCDTGEYQLTIQLGTNNDDAAVERGRQVAEILAKHQKPWKPRVRFCWICSKKLRGNFHRVILNDDKRECVVHAQCASRSRYPEVKR